MTKMGDILVRYDEDEDILCHHGVLGQRWGVRRYQNPDGSLTAKGKKHFQKLAEKQVKKAERAAKKEENRVKRAERAEVRKAAQAKKAEEDAIRTEKKKDALIREGNADKIYKNRSLFSDQEMNQALNRIRTNETIRQSGKTYQSEQQRKAATEAKARADAEKQRQAQQQSKNGKKSVQQILADTGKTAATVAGLFATYQKIAESVNAVKGEDTMPTFKNKTWKEWVDSKKPFTWDSDTINMVFDSAIDSRVSASNTRDWHDVMIDTPISDILYTYD